MKSFIALAVLAATAVASPFDQEVFAAREQLKSSAVHAAHLPFGKPPKPIDLSKYTIGQILNWTLHHPEHEHEEEKGSWWPFPKKEHRHTLPLHKIAFLANKTDDKFKELLFKEDATLTFLAPDDDAIKAPPHHRHGHDHEHDHEHDHPHPPPPHHGPPHHGPHDGPGHGKRDLDAFGPLEAGERINPFEFSELFEEDSDDLLEGDDDDKREKRRKFFRKLLSIVLRYHVLPDGAYTAHELADFATVRTLLPFSREDEDEHFRVRVRPILFPKPTLNFNVYSFAKQEVIAKNGIIYIINAPLLPPFSPLTEALLFPDLFSTLTSAVQQTELDEVLAPWLHGHKDEDEDDESIASGIMSLFNEIIAERVAKEGPRSFTVFAPTNLAWKRLGIAKKAFLFSPFGRRILKKVLAFHVVPDLIAFTDYTHNYTEKTQSISDSWMQSIVDDAAEGFEGLEGLGEFKGEYSEPFNGKDSEVDYTTLKTLLPGKNLIGKLVTYRSLHGKGPLVREAYVGGEDGKQRVKVFLADLPAYRGAIHVINSVLIPPHGEHEHERDLFEL